MSYPLVYDCAFKACCSAIVRCLKASLTLRWPRAHYLITTGDSSRLGDAGTVGRRMQRNWRSAGSASLGVAPRQQVGLAALNYARAASLSAPRQWHPLNSSHALPMKLLLVCA
jgi:hypothetical protein